MVMSKKMFIIVSSFLFGYCVGYNLFESVKSKNRKYEIHDFFLSYKKMANSVESLIKQMEKVKINHDCFLGKDLSYEKFFWKRYKKKSRKKFQVLKFLIFSQKGQWLCVLRYCR